MCLCMYVGVYVRLEQAVSGLFKNLQAIWGFSGLYCGCLGIVGPQPTLQSAPLTAQSARYICNGEVVFRMLFSFFSVLFFNTQ